nr:hypothetical protein [Gammaproteobacteria bacterium]
SSGLYRNDGSLEPLWTIDWFAHSTHVTNDGRFMVRDGPWAGATDQLGIAFYDNGALISWFAIGDVVSDLNDLVHTTSHFFWRQGEAHFDADSGVYKFATVSGDRLEFHAKTGHLATAETFHSAKVDAVLIANGRRKRIRGVSVCHSPLSHLSRAGPSQRDALMGSIDLPEKGLVRIIRIALTELVHMNKQLSNGEEKWLVTNADGESFEIELEGALCVRSDGAAQEVELGPVNRVEFTTVAEGSWQAWSGIGLINQRAKMNRPPSGR